MTERVLITGGGGFIGGHLTDVLEEKGYEVDIFDRKNGQDVRNLDDLTEAIEGQDVIFNLAGVLGTHELNARDRIPEAIETNIKGTVNVLEVACDNDVDVVQVTKPNPWLNTYSITKEAEQKFAQLYSTEHELECWLVRWFNVYGPGQHYGSPQKLVPTATVHALRDDPIEIFGDGSQTTDHIYVKDAVRATVETYECEEMEGEIVDVGSGDDRSVNEIVDIICDLTDSDSPVEHVPMRSGEEPNTEIRADITKLYAKVGFRPQWSLESGLESTVEYYNERVDRTDVSQ